MKLSIRQTQQWLTKATILQEKIEVILEGVRSRADRREIQQMYKSLKEEILLEAASMDRRRRGTCGPAESDYIWMIASVKAHLRAATNCNPFCGRLVQDLLYVKTDITWFISDIQHRLSI